MPTSRRNFLLNAGRAGGYSAAFALMQALDLAPAASTPTVPNWAPDTGKGKRVIVLGAGIAGLTAAYELQRAGFLVRVLEARERPGGRNWTIRRGDKVEFSDGLVQTAGFETTENYFNAGPARIPSVHRNILKYCHDLGVPLEVEVNSSRSALLVNPNAFNGKAIEQRQAINDTRGHVSELLAKSINQHALDQDLTEADRVRMLDFLRTYGDLDGNLKYQGTDRAGLAQMPGAADVVAKKREPLNMHDLLDADFWRGVLFEDGFDYQATMFQPVGGMDRIAWAFAKKLGPLVQYNCPVSEIHKTDGGVRITFQQAKKTRTFDAEFCVSTLPVTILRSVENDFAPRIKHAIENTYYAQAYKIGWEAPRFWETESNIYGGISWLTNHPITLVWYPSNNMFSPKGIIIPGYAQESQDTAIGKLINRDAKINASREAIELLHPGHGEDLKHPVYVSWARIPWSLGSWVSQTNFDSSYQEFNRPDGRIYFAGDYLSHLNAWQEGAILSAHRAVGMIADRARNT